MLIFWLLEPGISSGLENGMRWSEAIWNGAPAWLAFASASLLLFPLCGSSCAAQDAVKPPATAQTTAPGAKNNTAATRHRRKIKAGPEAKPSPSSEAANPPQVTLDNGKLTVDARNSNLNTILQDVAQKSGMSVDGLNKNTRVFGVYGPGSPRDVLSALLTGAGYNFVMAGGATGGVPRELVLTAQNGSTLPVHAVRPGQPQPAANNGGNPEANEDNDQNDPEIRMQRHLDTLRRMQQTILKQQQQQQNPHNPPHPQ